MSRVSRAQTLGSILLTGVAVIGFVHEAQAQIEEIVVTTRKRAENLHEVPIVVTAFTAASIERKGIEELADVAKYTNGLILDEGFSRTDTRITLRGLSPTRGRQNVAVLQDDVDISSLAIGQAGGTFIINPRLFDVERIEVVKGPHSALYGRSAFVGAINYITRKPSDEVQGSVQGEVGTYGKLEAKAGVSGPIVPGKLAMGVNGALYRFDGFYKNSVNGNNLGGSKGGGVAGNAVFTPNDTFKFTGRAEYSEDHFANEARIFITRTVDVPQPTNAITAPSLGGNPVLSGLNVTFPQVIGKMGHASDYPGPAVSKNPRTGQDYPGSDRRIFRTTLRAEADFGPALLTSITHYGNVTSSIFADQFGVGDITTDPTVNAIQETNIDTHTKLLTEEVRLQSNDESRLKWVLGGLFWNESVQQTGANLVCAAASGGQAQNCGAILAAAPANSLSSIVKRDTHHYSGFGSLQFAITDSLNISGEARYTKEVETSNGNAFGVPSSGLLGCGGLGAPGARVTTNGIVTCAGIYGPIVTGPNTINTFVKVKVPTHFWTPRVTVDYKLSPDALLYASAAKGEKPGGFSTVGGSFSAIADNTYAPEEMWVYEVGAKTEWLNHRLQFNVAGYYQDFSDKQVSVQVPSPTTGLPSTRVVNAASARVYGLEIDAAAALTDNVTVNVGYTVNDAKYANFTDVTTSAGAISRAGNCTVVRFANNTTNRCLVDYSGRMLEGAPKHNIQVGCEVRGQVSGDMTWFVDVDTRYQSKRYTTFENTLEIEAYFLADMRVGVRSNRWTVTAYCNNLLDDDKFKANGVYLPNWNVSFVGARNTVISHVSALLPDKRQLGLRMNYNF